MSESLVTAFTTALTGIGTDVTSILAVIIPAALTIAGTIFVVKKGMGWFKSLAK